MKADHPAGDHRTGSGDLPKMAILDLQKKFREYARGFRLLLSNAL
jgi:hypothetical protein